MLIEERIQKLLDKIYGSIQVQIDILDMNGTIVASSEKSLVGTI